MKELLQTLLLLLLATQISFAQWYPQNSGTTKNLHAVHFIDASNGWAVINLAVGGLILALAKHFLIHRMMQAIML